MSLHTSSQLVTTGFSHRRYRIRAPPDYHLSRHICHLASRVSFWRRLGFLSSILRLSLHFRQRPMTWTPTFTSKLLIRLGAVVSLTSTLLDTDLPRYS